MRLAEAILWDAGAAPPPGRAAASAAADEGRRRHLRGFLRREVGASRLAVAVRRRDRQRAARWRSRPSR